jgi:hypothetical protein
LNLMLSMDFYKHNAYVLEAVRCVAVNFFESYLMLIFLLFFFHFYSNEVKKTFDIQIWIVISEEFKLIDIVRKIIGGISTRASKEKMKNIFLQIFPNL